MPPSLELRTKQSLALTPRLQQSVRLLQLSSLEFQQELRNALDTNPFLEYDETQAEDNALSTDNGSSLSDAPTLGEATAPVDTPMTAESSMNWRVSGGPNDAYCSAVPSIDSSPSTDRP